MSQKKSCERPSLPSQSIEHLPNEDHLEQWEDEGGAMRTPVPAAKEAHARGVTAPVEEA
jgi:hypothetical protein